MPSRLTSEAGVFPSPRTMVDAISNFRSLPLRAQPGSDHAKATEKRLQGYAREGGGRQLVYEEPRQSKPAHDRLRAARRRTLRRRSRDRSRSSPAKPVATARRAA